jgi:hypothetical protein
VEEAVEEEAMEEEAMEEEVVVEEDQEACQQHPHSHQMH